MIKKTCKNATLRIMDNITTTVFNEKPYRHKGILNPENYKSHVNLRCYEPSPELAPFVELYFVARWERPDTEDIIISDILTRPVVNMFFTTHGTFISGVVNGVRSFRIGPSGIYAGVKFLPGGFRPFYNASVASITDRRIPTEYLFPKADGTFVSTLLAMKDDQGIVTQLENLLKTSAPKYDIRGLLARRAVEKVEADHSLTVESLAAELGLTVRGLQRLFQNYIGVGPKWTLKRSRLLHTLGYALEAEKPNWTTISAELNYSTQPHFINEFKYLFGITPTQYVKLISGASAAIVPKSQMMVI